MFCSLAHAFFLPDARQRPLVVNNLFSANRFWSHNYRPFVGNPLVWSFYRFLDHRFFRPLESLLSQYVTVTDRFCLHELNKPNFCCCSPFRLIHHADLNPSWLCRPLEVHQKTGLKSSLTRKEKPRSKMGSVGSFPVLWALNLAVPGHSLTLMICNKFLWCA